MDFFVYKKQQSVRIFVVVLAVLFLDQSCKLIVLEKFADIYLKKNYSSLLGLSANLYLFFLFLLAALAYFKKDIFFKSKDGAIFASALLFGGIISNAVDMFFYGYIVDYITFPKLFSFNIADLAICAGAFIIVWKILKK
ncbi:MAG: signal peptidase II [Candidatus Pacebacteria bacterium]|nr:signal peptidase II [Candidatus Paceibacterota bacterium]